MVYATFGGESEHRYILNKVSYNMLYYYLEEVSIVLSANP